VGATGLAAVRVFGASLWALGSGASRSGHEVGSGFVKARNGSEIFYKDWGSGPVVVLSHGSSLNSDAWQDQLFVLASNSCRVIAHDRRGHGRSVQSSNGNDIDIYADDLAAIMDRLNLRGVTLVRHSTGGGEITRYIGRHGTERLSKAMLVSAIPPIRLRMPANPDGAPLSDSDTLRKTVATNRAEFYDELSMSFFGANRPGSTVS
jgi:non-heme chloroperoxidase